jgi:glycosyltransferase involved in cell wall biosynthesis
MASGCCVIASRAGGNPELIVDGETGLLFEPGDATGLARQLLRVLEDPRLRTRLADAGSRYITREFPCKRSVERLERVYREKLARKRH